MMMNFHYAGLQSFPEFLYSRWQDTLPREAFPFLSRVWKRAKKMSEKPKELRKYGLDVGEASLFLAAQVNDRLVLDEANARRFAESKGLKFTGLLGLIVAAAGAKKITEELAPETINKLSSGDFRMSLELYLWAREKIENS